MSPEEAHRDAQRRDQEMIEAQSSGQRVGSWNSRRKSSHGIPPMPSHLPPAPPNAEGQDTVDKAKTDARRAEMQGNMEKDVPDRTLSTAPFSDTRDSMQHEPVLPVVEEAGETLSREDTEVRPETPYKDKLLPPTRAPPPTPPKPGHLLHPGSSDSGYAGNSNGNSDRFPKMSRSSLDKDLPPLPNKAANDSGVRMVA